jgi:hypothetical protein
MQSRRQMPLQTERHFPFYVQAGLKASFQLPAQEREEASSLICLS